jgi:hypothetical protein
LESIQPSKKQDADAGTYLDESNISEWFINIVNNY